MASDAITTLSRERSDPGALIAPVYSCGYSDQLDGISKDATFPVPTGPGLGVTCDWDYIVANWTAFHLFDGADRK